MLFNAENISLCQCCWKSMCVADHLAGTVVRVFQEMERERKERKEREQEAEERRKKQEEIEKKEQAARVKMGLKLY